MNIPSKRRNQPDQNFEWLDSIDRRLIAELQDDARLRLAELARRVGLSAPAVADRLRRLTDSGALTCRAEVDPRALGYPVCAIVRVSPWNRDLRAIPEVARQTPEVTECYRITGEDCFLIKLHAPAIGQLEATLDRFLAYGNTTTSVVVSTPVSRRPPPLPL